MLKPTLSLAPCPSFLAPHNRWVATLTQSLFGEDVIPYIVSLGDVANAQIYFRWKVADPQLAQKVRDSFLSVPGKLTSVACSLSSVGCSPGIKRTYAEQCQKELPQSIVSLIRDLSRASTPGGNEGTVEARITVNTENGDVLVDIGWSMNIMEHLFSEEKSIRHAWMCDIQDYVSNTLDLWTVP